MQQLLALDKKSSVLGRVERSDLVLFIVVAMNILTEITTLAITLYGEITYIVNDK